MKGLQRQHYMPCQHQLCAPGNTARDTGNQIISSHVSVDKIDLMFVNEPGYAPRAESPERIADRNMHKTLARQKVQPVLPLVGRPKCNENFVAPQIEFTA